MPVVQEAAGRAPRLVWVPEGPEAAQKAPQWAWAVVVVYTARLPVDHPQWWCPLAGLWRLVM